MPRYARHSGRTGNVSNHSWDLFGASLNQSGSNQRVRRAYRSRCSRYAFLVAPSPLGGTQMDTTIELTRRVDTTALEQKVKAMYRDVALAPQGEFHFEMGRALGERLGYAPGDLDAIPSEAIDSFSFL